MFSYFNKSATIRFEDIKVRVQIEVEIEESIGKLITGGEKEFQFNTDKKTVITASTRNNHNTHHRILERFYKDISQLVIEEFKVDSSVFKKRTKVLEKLRSEGEIPDHAFVDLKSSYEDEINTLKASCSTIVDKIRDTN